MDHNSNWSALPAVIGARAQMIRAAQAWQAVAPDDDRVSDPLTDEQLMLLVDALAAQRTYLDVKTRAKEAQIIRLP